MTSSARRLRNCSMRRCSPASGPPQRSRPSASTGVRGALASDAISTSSPSTGMTAPCAKGSLGSTRASCASIHSRWSSAQASAARRLVRHGQVSLSVPLASSNRRRRRLALLSWRMRIGAGSAASSAASERLVDHMIFELAGVVLADRPAAGRLPRLMYCLAAAGDQIMPIGKRLARRTYAIGAGLWQPVERAQILAIELHAIGNQLHPVLVIEAAAVLAVEELARDVGRVEQARLLVLELVYAAAAAAVAQRLPFAAVQHGKRLFPKWRAAVHLKSSLALLSRRDQAG